MRAGRLDRRITIESIAVTRDSETGEEVKTPTTFATTWAKYDPNGGREFFEAQQVTAARRGTFLIRWQTGLLETMRILYDGLTWDIDRIDEKGRREGLLLYAQARAE